MGCSIWFVLSDMIGLGRPMVMEPDLPASLISGASDAARPYGPVNVFVYYQQLRRLADGLAPDFELDPAAAVSECMRLESAAAKALTGRAAQ